MVISKDDKRIAKKVHVALLGKVKQIRLNNNS